MIRRIDMTTNILTDFVGLAGTPGTSWNNIDGTSARISGVFSVYLDSAGSLYASLIFSSVILKVNTSTGYTTRFAGTAAGTFGTLSLDRSAATATALPDCHGVTGDTDGTIYLGFQSEYTIYRVINGIMTPYIGNSIAGYSTSSRESSVNSYVRSIVWANENMFFTSGQRTVRKATLSLPTPTSQPSRQPSSRPTRQPSCQPTSCPSHPSSQPTVQPSISNSVITVAGGPTVGSGVFTDGVAATPLAVFADPHQIFYDTSSGALYVADISANVVVKVTSGGLIYRVAGKGSNSAGTSNVQATSVVMISPSGVYLDSSGNIFVCELTGHRIRKISATTGIITTFAGSSVGTAGSTGSNGLATSALLSWPEFLAIDTAGQYLYVAELFNYCVRRIDLSTNIITNYIGLPGTAGTTWNNVPGTSARIGSAFAMYMDTSGNLYFSVVFSNIYLTANATGFVSILAGTSTFGTVPPGRYNALTTNLPNCHGITGDADGNIFLGFIDQYTIFRLRNEVMTPYLGKQ